MKQRKKKPNALAIISSIIFMICIMLHIISDLLYKSEFTIEPFTVAGFSYYLICILLIISATKNSRLSATLAITLIAAVSVYQSILIFNHMYEIYNGNVEGFFYQFAHYQNRYNILILAFAIDFLINIILSRKEKTKIITKIYSYLCVIFGFVLIAYSVFEATLSEVDYVGILHIEPFLWFHFSSINYILIDRIHMIVLFLGLTSMSMLYCKKIEIKSKLNNITNEENVISTYENAKKIKGYHELLDKGIITEQEYEKKKQELL